MPSAPNCSPDMAISSAPENTLKSAPISSLMRMISKCVAAVYLMPFTPSMPASFLMRL